MVKIKLAPIFWADLQSTPKFSGVFPFWIPIPKNPCSRLSTFIGCKNNAFHLLSNSAETGMTKIISKMPDSGYL